MSTIVKTEIVLVSQNTTYNIPGDWSAQDIINNQNYRSSMPGIENMVYEESVVARAEGNVRVITFTQRTGNKG
jgi:hypothetical protein